MEAVREGTLLMSPLRLRNSLLHSDLEREPQVHKVQVGEWQGQGSAGRGRYEGGEGKKE